MNIFKKWRCESAGIQVGTFFIGLLGILNLLNLPVPSRHGLTEPSLEEGILFLSIAITIYLFGKFICKKPIYFICPSCNESYFEKEIKNNKCPSCNIDVIEIEHYYKKSNKTEK